MDDAQVIMQFLDEMESADASLLEEAAAIVEWLRDATERYELTKLLSGTYDKKGARINISAGAGGTDAQVDGSCYRSVSDTTKTAFVLPHQFACPCLMSAAHFLFQCRIGHKCSCVCTLDGQTNKVSRQGLWKYRKAKRLESSLPPWK